jgi:hypothetical protein
MPATISASVGLGGKNKTHDEIVVQQLLLQHGFRIGRADGICGSLTIRGLTSFQRGFLHVPDGRVDPGGRTWHHLVQVGAFHHGSPFTRLVARPAHGTINVGLEAVSTSFMVQQLGRPRDSYSEDCQDVTDPVLNRNMLSAQVGPIRVTGLAPALRSLQTVFSEINSKQPDVYSLLGTVGMLCCRYQRGSTTAVSNHSWGTAIDLTIAGVLDKRGDGKVQYGMTLIAPIFNQCGWYWGAGFHVEDGMHFEGSCSLIRSWKLQLV